MKESVRLAAGKTDLAEELFSMLLEQLSGDLLNIRSLWRDGDHEALLECVHKLHGATRYCGVPDLRMAAGQLETGLKQSAPDVGNLTDRLLAAIERLEIWTEQTDWQSLFRNHHTAAAGKDTLPS